MAWMRRVASGMEGKIARKITGGRGESAARPTGSHGSPTCEASAQRGPCAKTRQILKLDGQAELRICASRTTRAASVQATFVEVAMRKAVVSLGLVVGVSMLAGSPLRAQTTTE